MTEYVFIALFFTTLAVAVPKSLVKAGKIQAANYYPALLSRSELGEYFVLFALGVIFAVAENYCKGAGVIAFEAAVTLLMIYYSVGAKRMRVKFRFTARATRFYLLYFAFQTAVGAAVFAFESTAAAIAYCAFALAFSGLVTDAAALAALPFEKANNARYLKKYSEKFARLNCIRVAVTGSYGKTGVKNMLKTVLEGHYTVLVTAGNMNTPFGIVKSLESYRGEQVFVAEFGARRKGDIDELVRLLKPDYGIITGVCEQHLETFGSIERVAAEKARLGEALEDPARLVLNGANEYTMKMAKRFPSALTAGAEGDVRAEKVTETEKGLRFFLTFKGEKRFVEFPLHGKYNAYNAAMAAATALKLGVPLKDIAARLKLIRPVPHRFEVKREGEITVIDDGYNSNIEGALSSAESLKAFSGRKIVVAQGITELGKAKKRINARFADALAEAADMVVLVGENAGIIKKELGKRAFNGKIIRLRHFSEVEKTLAALLESGDVVWFQNDIP